MQEKQQKSIEIRVDHGKRKVLEALEKMPILPVAWERAGISKATFYRWRDEDKEFAENVEISMTEGIALMCNIAKTNLFSLMKEKNFAAIRYVLERFEKDIRFNRPNSEAPKIVIADEENLRILYAKKPISMHKEFPSTDPMRWPKVIQEAYTKMWSGKYPRIIIKAPRGGGKSMLLGTVGFDLWFLKNRKVVNMGGSLAQAKIVYNYFTSYCEIDPSVECFMKGKPTMVKTMSVDDNYFSCVTASMKQIRGPHPDVLISDETCESEDDLIHAALPMINSSQSPLVIMASTFHKIYGIFQETWDNAQERGYLRIQWDIFDVTEQFSPEYWLRPDVAAIPDISKLQKHANGRNGDPNGWISIENIVQAWKEKHSEEWFEIEYLGNRPSSAGLVLKPEDIERALFDSETDKKFRYIQGADVVIGIDWGFSSMTAVTEFMRHLDQVVVMIDNKNYRQAASEDIIKAVVEQVKQKGVRFVYADSAGKFENIALQSAFNKNNIGCKVVEVVFSTEKEGMLGNLRAHFEQGKIKLPTRFKDATWQLKRYRYQENTDKPVKKDDHIPDSIMCALQHFVLGKFARPMPMPPTPPKEGGDKPITAGLMDKIF